MGLLGSCTNLKQGIAHFRIWMSGSISLAMDSSTTMLVMRVANSPSSFMLLSLMMFSIPIRRLIPSMSKMLVLSKTLNSFLSCCLYSSKVPSISFLLSKFDNLQMRLAQFSLLPSMMDLMKLVKLRRSCSLSLMTMPTSITLILMLSVHFLIISRIRFSYSQLDLYRALKVSFSIMFSTKYSSTCLTFSFTQAAISLKNVADCLVTSTRMFPPWQSAWMKLFFISIQKKVEAPSLAIKGFRGCLLLSKWVTGTPSTKLSIRIESRVSFQNAWGKLTLSLPWKCLLKILRLSFSTLKSIWSMRVFLREASPTGISQALENRAKNLLIPNMMFTSL